MIPRYLSTLQQQEVSSIVLKGLSELVAPLGLRVNGVSFGYNVVQDIWQVIAYLSTTLNETITVKDVVDSTQLVGCGANDLARIYTHKLAKMLVDETDITEAVANCELPVEALEAMEHIKCL